MNRLLKLLMPVLVPAVLPSCTLAISKINKPLPEIPGKSTPQQVHQALGEPTASKDFNPPLPLGKDPILHAKGAPLSMRNDRRPVILRESYVLKGHYRKPGDPDGAGGLAELSRKAFWLPEIFLGPFASLEWLAHLNRHGRVTVWYSPQKETIFVWKE